MACVAFRFVVLFMAMTAVLLENATKVNLDVAIVSMVSPIAADAAADEAPIVIDICGPIAYDNRTTMNKTSDKSMTQLPWSQTTQGVILGASFYGYILLQIPFGRISELFGGKYIVAIGILVSGVINLLTPLLARSVPLMITSRIALGIFQVTAAMCKQRADR